MFAEELKKPARELQWLALGMLLGMLILAGKLWHTQVVSRKRYEQSLQIQSIRTVPLLPPRGRLVENNGRLLAENQPRYDVKLYLEDIRPLFYHHYTNSVRRAYFEANPGVKLTRSARFHLEAEARYQVASNIVMQASAAVGTPLILSAQKFGEHYTNKLSLPLTIIAGLKEEQISSFMEKAAGVPGVALEPTPARVYPFPGIATHIIGYIGRSEITSESEDFRFSYPIQGIAGRTGLERAFDNVLRGTPGVKALLVNNIGYAQSESTRQPPQPGWDVHLTLDLEVQKAADEALRMSGPDTRGAAVVMDVRNGDILAIASSPTFDLNLFVNGVDQQTWEALNDPRKKAQFNRATEGLYPPGSVFKIVVGLAALEAGVDPKELYESAGNYRLGRSKIGDTAGPGLFDFRRAIVKSSNPYFIHQGLRIGKDRIFAMGKQFKLGERTGYLSRVPTAPAMEKAGYFPNPQTGLKIDGLPWQDGDTANLSIGHGEILVTPLQIASMLATVANKGTIYTPRLVKAIHPQDPNDPSRGEFFEPGILRGRVNASDRSWSLLHEAMVADTEDPEGTGKRAFLEGYRICGKTGTADLDHVDKDTGDRRVVWFASFAPYENPRYAVIVMQEGAVSGGVSCAPKARHIYEALKKRDSGGAPAPARTLTFQEARP